MAVVATERVEGGQEWVIVYDADRNFVPPRVDVAAGTTIRFLNLSDVSVWPASNIHPSHAILPAFDPLGPIPPGQSWAYHFDTPGFWRYHNHLDPGEVGLVVALGDSPGEPPPVVTDGSLDFPVASVEDTARYDPADPQQLRQFVAEYGPAQAIALLHQYQTDTGRSCHDLAHIVGRVAYELFGPVTVTLIIHECQSGSLHGAIEALFADRGTTNLDATIREVCSYTHRQFDRHNCTHGIGHGLMAWTSYDLPEALALCDYTATPVDALSCQTGVFMENGVAGQTGIMGHTSEYIDLDDPHYPCNIVQDRFVDSCYTFQTSIMLVALGYDYDQIAAACTDAAGATARHTCFGSLGRDISAREVHNHALTITVCGAAPTGELRVACLTGAAQNLFWDPTGGVEARAFCALLANPDEHTPCYETIIQRAADILTDDDRSSFCESLPGSWPTACLQR